jgi:phage-related protein
MAKLSNAQQRKIFMLCREKGLDDEMRRGYIHSLVGKESTKELTIHEAIKVIDALEGKKANAPDRLSTKQQKFIEGLAKQYGWIGENKKADMKRLNGWLEKRYGVSSIIWLTPKNASDAIEGLKVMIKRDRAESDTA